MQSLLSKVVGAELVSWLNFPLPRPHHRSKLLV